MKYIRLQTAEPLDETQVELFYDCVEQHANIELTTALDDDGEVISDEVAVCVYTETDHTVYEIRISADTADSVLDLIAETLHSELESTVDFELNITDQ